MNNKQHRTTALFLAFLVLISTTGFSMNIMLCNCTGEQYMPLFTQMACCEKEQVSSKNTPAHCCSKKDKKDCDSTQKEHSKLGFKTKKDCCKNGFQYAKANINLDLVQTLDLSLIHFVLTTVTNFPISWESIDFLLPPSTISLGNPNKAPPRVLHGLAYLNLIQTYRC